MDIIALVLAVAIAVFLMAQLIELVLDNKELPDTRVSILKGLLDSIIAIVSMYIGSKLNKKDTTQ